MKKKLICILSALLVSNLFILPIQANAESNTNAKETNYSNNKYNLTVDNTALIIIDVQKNFIPGMPECFVPEIPGQNTPSKLENVKKLAEMAKTTGMKTLVTFENADYGDAAMPEDIINTIPTDNSTKYIKTYFDITKKDSIYDNLKSNPKIKNIVVCGAETDVCILQSVRGLIKMGYNVFLSNDATYTSTTLNKPAITFMSKIGANVTNTDTLISSIKNKKPVRSNFTGNTFNKIPDMDINNSAMVVVNFDDNSLKNNDDSKKDAKIERIEFMCDLARISNVPLYFVYNDSMEEVKKIINIPSNAIFIKGQSNKASIEKSLIKTLKSSGKTDIMLSGIDENYDLAATSLLLNKQGLKVYLLEDGFFKNSKVDYNNFNSLYKKNVIPSSLKICLYEIGESATYEENPDNIGEKYVNECLAGNMNFIESLTFVEDSQGN